MLFSSIPFLYYFLPAVFILYFIAPNKLKNAVLLLSSLVFYAWGEPKYVFLMLASITSGYIFGLLIEKSRSDRKKAKLFLAGSVAISLGLLLYFKYADFFIGNFNAATGLSVPLLRLSLPVGISFYTFQLISYAADVYRGLPAQRNPISFGAYIAMFPQLIAGPIVKYVDIEAQLRERTFDAAKAGSGIFRFLTGLFKKAVIANIAGELATKFLDGNLSTVSVLGAWIGIFSYALQIYFDFSAYSDMAIGLGKMFGFDYMENFNYPYIADSVNDFWKRWHISLTTFFREYLYIPLGGNRKHQVLNLLIVWAFTGLWHGASWNFILWGLYYYVLIVLEKLFLGNLLEKIPKVFSHIYTLFVVLIGWVFFYFDDLSKLRTFFKVMFGANGNLLSSPADLTILKNHILFFIFAIIACMPVARLIKEKVEKFANKNFMSSLINDYSVVIASVFLLILDTAAVVGSTYNPFLYFRF